MKRPWWCITVAAAAVTTLQARGTVVQARLSVGSVVPKVAHPRRRRFPCSNGWNLPRGGDVTGTSVPPQPEEEVSSSFSYTVGMVVPSSSSHSTAKVASALGWKLPPLEEEASDGDSSSSPSGDVTTAAVCVRDDPASLPRVWRKKDDTNSAALAETLALTCDAVLVVVAPPEDASSISWWNHVCHSMVRAARRRRQAGLKPLWVVLVLANPPNDPAEQAKNDLVLHPALEPLFSDEAGLERVEVVTLGKELEDLWHKDLSPALSSRCHPTLIDADAMVPLLEQVYGTLAAARTQEEEKEGTRILPVPVVEDDPEDRTPFQPTTVESTQSAVEEDHHFEEESYDFQEEHDDEVQENKNDALPLEPEDVRPLKEPEPEEAPPPQQTLEQQAFYQLQDLSQQLDQVWLQQDDDASSPRPLHTFKAQLEAIVQPLPPPTTSLSLQSMVQNVYQLHLSMLRDFVGRRYEQALLQYSDDPDKWTAVAQSCTEEFQTMAQQAIPQEWKSATTTTDSSSSSSSPLLDYLPSLQGLVADMMEATSVQQGPWLSQEEDDDDEELPTRKRKWVKTLLARAVALGVNYAQGWLAWQSIRRAAAQRDLDCPKFPLF